jgi:hypothetical protein
MVVPMNVGLAWLLASQTSTVAYLRLWLKSKVKSSFHSGLRVDFCVVVWITVEPTEMMQYGSGRRADDACFWTTPFVLRERKV